MNKPQNVKDYKKGIQNPVNDFWETRKDQFRHQTKKDKGTRGQVTGGKPRTLEN